jgi:hypothetical protein
MVDGSAVVEILEARKKKGKKGKKDDSLPGPLIGYLIKKGVIRKGKKKYKKGAAKSKSAKRKYKRGSISRGMTSTKSVSLAPRGRTK